MPVPQLTIETEPTADEIRFLEDRLYDFNVAATGIDDGEYLAIFERDAAGTIVAGLCGITWGGCCEIRQLWVAETRRGAALGSALLQAAEAEALRRGCEQVVLSTHSFQAPAFYRRFGYDVVSVIDNYPRGHSSVLMRKALTGQT